MRRLKQSAIKTVIAIGLYRIIFAVVGALLGGNNHISNANTLTTLDVVDCLDTLSTKENKSFHISFIGDSLVRNQYTNFIKLIPQYDRKISVKLPWSALKHFHGDHSVTHGLFNDFHVSFRWMPLINEILLSHFKKLNALDDLQVPDLIFFGVSVHHMLNTTDDDRSFEKILEQDLLPLLKGYLAANPFRQLIWLLQPTSLDYHASIPDEVDYLPEIHFDLIHHYNQNIKRIISGTGIMIWDDDSHVKEYIRGCALVGYQRIDPEELFLCHENHHPGFGVIFSFSTQVLFQHVCNSYS